MKQTMIQLPPEMVRALDQRAVAQGVSRSALVREILQEAIANDQQSIIGARIAEGYRRIPPGVPDEWGDTEAMSDRSTVDLLHRLDREERKQGHAPW